MRGVERSLYFMFREENGPRKVAIGLLYVLLSVFVVGIPFIVGYLVEIIRRVARDEQEALPEWVDHRDLFLDGLRGSAVLAIYAGPFAMISLILRILAGPGPSTLVSNFLWIVNLILVAAGFLVVTQVLVTYSRERRLECVFEVGDIIDGIVRNVREYFVVLVLTLGAFCISWLVQWLLGKFCVVSVGVWFVTLVLGYWMLLVAAHAIGMTQQMPPVAAAPSPQSSDNLPVIQPDEESEGGEDQT